ncbi:DNA primase [Halorarum salinum]|uniref:DNA primase large subunit PriL n=1 Tax=Halorarum salinum TaxID=2743089 RepID=A0A7D5QEW1_9EURY|nr:DNA primase [Halobaculum salinum]QLG60983.1 DNA primase [Halobaculum salinum]
MDPLYARYPFFANAREAVREAGVDLATLVAERDPAVERGRERVERALVEGTVASETPREWEVREELLSYPLARILVSLLDSPAAVEKYAGAEALTAHERFTADVAREGPPDPSRVDLDALFREFDLADRTRPENPPAGAPEPQWFRLGVGAYLEYVDPRWGDEWRLVNRELADGEVRVPREGLFRVLREAVEARVADGLPFEGVDGDLAAELEDEIADLRDLLAERATVADFDVVAPEHFPPCLARLLDRARAGEADEFDPQERFALLSFLAGLNLDVEGVVTLTEGGFAPDDVAAEFASLRDESGAQYPPPSCETLGAYGVCENEGEHRREAPHPLEFYARRLREADEVVDWRERRRGADANPDASVDA